jgi:hypothetical protein
MAQLTERPLTAMELADKLNLSKEKVWGLMRAGKIPVIDYGHRAKRFLLSDVWTAIYGDGPAAIKSKQEED